MTAAFRRAFPGNPWRLRGTADAAPDLTRFVNQAALFMTLLGLAALVVGGIGVANGVEAWLTARARTIATLRCLGASARLIGLIYGMQLLLLGVPGILLGLAVGAAAPLLVLPLLRGQLPLPAHLGLLSRAVGAGGYLRPACGPRLRAPPLAPRDRHLRGRSVPVGWPAGALAVLMAGQRGANIRGVRPGRTGSTFRAEAFHRFRFLRRHHSHLGLAARHCGAADAPAASCSPNRAMQHSPSACAGSTARLHPCR